jgi:cytochrome c oxidase assembly protein subunit 11
MSSPSPNRNLSLAVNLSMIVAGMLGMAYASVPLYRLFCEVTGYGGTTRESTAHSTRVLGRSITVRFNADIDKNLAWEFKPSQAQVSVNIGEEKLVYYTARNLTGKPLTGRAAYNVIPFSAGSYFVKIECFCFKEQTLQPDQSVTMPVLFYVDPSLDDNPDMKNVSTITLSYTFFPVKTEAK